MAPEASYNGTLTEPLKSRADGTGIVTPKNVIKTVSQARAIFDIIREQHRKRIVLFSNIEGLLAGNPPYDPKVLAAHGLSHIANFNTLDGNSLFKRSAQAYWNLLYQSECLVEFNIFGNDPELKPLADIMAREFDFVIKKWKSFYTHVCTLATQLVKFGLSPVIWPDEKDWRWNTVELTRFYVPDQTLSDLESLTYFAVETVFTAQQLWEIYEKTVGRPQNSTPWDAEELRKLLLDYANRNIKSDNQVKTAMDIQQRIQNGDFIWDGIWGDGIRIVSLYRKEYDGKITHYMFERTYSGAGFIFFADRQYDSFSELLALFTASPGEFTIHSNRGVGHLIYSQCQATMQMDCSVVDAARWAATPMIKTTPNPLGEADPIRFYPGTPTNLHSAELLQNNIGANIDQIIGASQYFLQKMNYNIANAGDDPGIPDRAQGSISPLEAKMRSYREFGILKFNINHFYDSFDHVFNNMTVRFMKSKTDPYAKEWRKRCIEKGVPEQLLEPGRITPWGSPERVTARASRAAGAGSIMGLLLALQEVTQIAGMFGPREQRELKKMWIIATFGPDYLPVFTQDSSDGDDTSQDATIAALENNSMQNGQTPLFSPANGHKAHIEVHMALILDTLQRVTIRQITASEADGVLNAAIPHTEEHINAIAQNIFLQDFYKQMSAQWKQIKSRAQQNRAAAIKEKQAEIRRQEQLAEQEQQAMSDAERKDFIAQRDAQRADFKVENQVERAKDANENRAEIMREKVHKDASNKRLQVQLEAQAKREKSPQQEILDITGTTPSATDFEEIR